MDPKLFSEIQENARKALKVDKERAQLFEVMLKSKGWEVYVTLINAHLQARSDALLTPAGSVDGAVALEYVKGAMSGLVLARDLPSAIIADMKSATSKDGGGDEDS